MDEKFLIHVEIADKTYGLWIRRDDEQLVREAAKQLRKKINEYRQNYTKSELDMKDLLAMVALQLSVYSSQLEEKNDTAPFTEKIEQLTSELEMYLEGK
ncbi:cell division protein ZapA (FtsZ GTPase activity inhibitor) [Parabacteroides sp. PFB2-12]|uniref:cell division protein ZapA n=1 Tax=unclassified Parabacteroides TaxID=2649774 RepID=UPI0024761D45|nr:MULTISPECIES: cell division protein ZapA [unclassified Parabacteroides]MDH6341188.1 cell division protein ZapA (FtsZ GTPase activity inhibitor) [Parabacteroides sp. PM6-13]MDH6389378.1 cell division protein ZapA (FtsZ GTPase activity inhibitor) [Parabacteroides sp. PFB2-12]